MKDPNLKGNNFAERLRAAMSFHGLHQKELADKLHIATSTMNLWFHGKRGIRGEHLTLLSKALGVRPDWLAFGVGHVWRSQEPGALNQEPYDTPEGWRWIPCFLQTSPILHWLKSDAVASARLEKLNASLLLVRDDCGDNLGLNRLDLTTSKTFALHVFDRAMQPVLSMGDLLFFESPQSIDFQPQPSDFVLATVGELQTAEIVLRQYRRVGFEMDDYSKKEHFELVASNPDYPSFDSKKYRIKILAVAFEMHKHLKK